MNLKPTYEEIHGAVLDICGNIRELGVDIEAIVGVSRGGLIPAVIASHELDLPLIPISYSSVDGAGDDKNHHNSLPYIDARKILIVDDICDTSLTLAELVAYYQSQGKLIHTAVLHYKVREDGKHIPDFYWQKIPVNSGWVIYPFEK